MDLQIACRFGIHRSRRKRSANRSLSDSRCSVVVCVNCADMRTSSLMTSQPANAGLYLLFVLVARRSFGGVWICLSQVLPKPFSGSTMAVVQARHHLLNQILDDGEELRLFCRRTGIELNEPS